MDGGFAIVHGTCVKQRMESLAIGQKPPSAEEWCDKKHMVLGKQRMSGGVHREVRSSPLDLMD